MQITTDLPATSSQQITISIRSALLSFTGCWIRFGMKIKSSMTPCVFHTERGADFLSKIRSFLELLTSLSRINCRCKFIYIAQLMS